MTEWENHRTQTAFENNLIVKIFLFYFVNSYTSLYYIAFFKSKSRLFNSDKLEDQCKWILAGGDIFFAEDEAKDADKDWEFERNISNGCVDELTVQIFTILAVNMFVGQAREIAIP